MWKVKPALCRLFHFIGAKWGFLEPRTCCGTLLAHVVLQPLRAKLMFPGRKTGRLSYGSWIASGGLAALVSFSAAGKDAEPILDELEAVEVIGHGEVRQLLRLGPGQLQTLPGGTTVLKALERLPGVNFHSADSFGANEWSVRLTVRGFAQNQLGFTLDGVPLGDMSYANHNGLHVSRAIVSEDVGEVRLSQGAGALGTASTSNLGGTIEFFSSNPAAVAGGRGAVTAGSQDTRRLYGRFDSGLFGTGTSVFVSASDSNTRKWRGAGNQQQRNFTFKLQQDVGATRLAAFANYSDRTDIDYQDLSYDLISRRGYFWDNLAPDWNSAVTAAQQCANSGFSNAQLCDDAYWDSSTLRRDLLTYISADFPLGARMKVDARLYLHRNHGQGLWATPYTPTPGGAPFSIRTTDFEIDRHGFISRLRGDLGAHQLQAGLWYESNRFNQTRMFVGEPLLSGPSRSFREFQSDPFLTQWDYDFETRTVHLHLQDEWQISQALRGTFGAKMMDVRNSVATITGPAKNGSIRARDRFLPQAGFVYSLTDRHELFASATSNLRAYISAGFAGPFGTSAAGFAAIRDSLRPERSTTWEAGWRFRSTQLQGSAAVYRVEYQNRLLSIQPGPIVLGNPALLANVGSVTTTGAELALDWKPLRGLNWFSSVTLNDSQFNDDYVTNGRTVAVRGRQLPDAPRLVLRSEISFDTGQYWMKLAGSQVGKRFYTYLNDGAVPGNLLFNAGLGFRFAGTGQSSDRFNEMTLQLDVMNLANKRYIATAGSTDFVESDVAGTRQTLLPGAPRQYYVTLRARL